MPQVFDITAFGAVGDGVRDNAASIQKAIDACSSSGGGIVRIPGEGVFVAGPFKLKSQVEFHLEQGAIVRAHPDEKLYTMSAFRDNWGEGSIWIGGEHANAVSITGHGTIDGNGIAFMGAEEKAAYALKDFVTFDRRPHVLTLIDFHQLSIRGVTFKNSAYWCVHLIGCEDVTIEGIRIDNSLKIRNSDGIDLDHTRNVAIRDCEIQSGDDCICFKTRREYDEFGPTENVTVERCVMTSTSCAIKLGSENMDAIRNVDVHDCTIRSSNRGIGIQNRDEGLVENIRFANMTVEGRLFDDVWWGKAEPIYVTAFRRQSKSGKDSNIRFARGQTVGKVGVVQNVVFENIECVSENGIFIGGDPGKIKEITLDGVRVTLNKTTGFEGGVYDLRPSDTEGLLRTGTSGIYLRKAEGISLRNCSVGWGPQTPEYYDVAVRSVDVQGLMIENFTGTNAAGSVVAVKLEQTTNITNV